MRALWFLAALLAATPALAQPKSPPPPAITGSAPVNGHCVEWTGPYSYADAGAACGTGSGSVTAVENSDGTLTISPTTGTVIASLNLAHANVWTAILTDSLNATTLPSPQSGAVMRAANVDGTSTRMELDAFGASGFYSVVGYGGTNASPTGLTSGIQIGGYNSFGYNGSAVVGPNASMRTYAAQNWSVGANGTYVDIATTPNGSTTLTQVIEFQNDGGMTTPTQTDEGAGTLNAAGLYVAGISVLTTGAAKPYAYTSWETAVASYASDLGNW